ncbi:MAG: histidine--tRNA ligase [Dehalococcoidia bacterium]
MFTAPRGLADVLPDEQAYWRHVRAAAERLAGLYGYRPIDTPVFEEVGVFERGIGEGTDIVEKEMFLLQPRREEARRFALRPEATAGLCRAYIEHGMASLPAPVRLYWQGPNFRYERPQAGRLRQFSQVNIEAIGSDDPALDAEIIQYAWNLYRDLGLRDLTVLVNSIGDRESRAPFLAALQDHFRPHFDSLDADDQMRFAKNPLRLLDSKNERTRELLAGAPDLHEALNPGARDHFERVQAYLTAAGIPFVIEQRLVRGFDYYTHTVFEIVPPNAGSQGTIGGGGRYDGLIELLGGRPTPAVGFATGVERIVLNLKARGITPAPLPAPDAYVAHVGPGAAVAAMEFAAALRDAGVGALLATGGRSLKAQMRAANNGGYGTVAIIGADEAAQGTVKLHDLRGGRPEEALPRAEAVARLAAGSG